MIDEPEIRRIRQRDLCGGFCAGPGYEKLDEFLRQYAKQNEKRNQTVTHVAALGEMVIGYATTVPGTVEPGRIRGLVKGLSSYPAPVLVLARLATDIKSRGRNLGPRLMREAVFDRALMLANEFGCIGVYVDAKHPVGGGRGSDEFYRRYDFIELPSTPRPAPQSSADEVPSPPPPTSTTPMFLPLETVRRLVSAATSK